MPLNVYHQRHLSHAAVADDDSIDAGDDDVADAVNDDDDSVDHLVEQVI